MPQMEKTDVPSAGAQGWAFLWGFSILSAFNLYWGESISFTIVFTWHVGLDLFLLDSDKSLSRRAPDDFVVHSTERGDGI